MNNKYDIWDTYTVKGQKIYSLDKNMGKVVKVFKYSGLLEYKIELNPTKINDDIILKEAPKRKFKLSIISEVIELLYEI